MFLGAMLHAGLALETLQQALAGLPLSGYHLELRPYTDKGIQGVYFDVQLLAQEQPTRHLSDIVALLHEAHIAPSVRTTALAVFRCLAEAEATVHGVSIDEVHFHEVGAVDAIVDIVGAAVAIETLGIAHLYASALPLTHGHVKTSHGLLPVPAPATLEILRRVQAPWQPRPVEGELVTPTGAALLATLAHFEIPPMHIEQVGYGFGKKQMPWPNCLRLCLGTSVAQAASSDVDTDWVTVIETNIDTMSGELFGGLMERLLQAGALDVSYTPIQMKKNRPAILLRVICMPQDSEALSYLLLRETSTLGVRMQQMQRRKAQRSMQQISTSLGPILVKIKRLGHRVISAAPEYEECQRLATEHQMPLADVYELARRAIAEAIV